MELLKKKSMLLLAPSCCARTVPHYLQLEKKWHKMHLGQRKRGINSQHRNDAGFLLSMWFAGSLSKPGSSLQTHLVSAGGKGPWENNRHLRNMNQNRNASREGKSSLNLLSTTLRTMADSGRDGMSNKMFLRKRWIQDYRDEKGNSLSSMEVPRPPSTSDFYSIVTGTGYHKLDKGTDPRLLSRPFLPRKYKALHNIKGRISCCLFNFGESPGSFQNS